MALRDPLRHSGHGNGVETASPDHVPRPIPIGAMNAQFQKYIGLAEFFERNTARGMGL
jgi:hypothetical protein